MAYQGKHAARAGAADQKASRREAVEEADLSSATGSSSQVSTGLAATTGSLPVVSQDEEISPITAAVQAVMSHRQIMLVIFGLMSGMFLSSLDQTVVSTAIRTIGDDLHGLDQQAWVTTAYLITSTISTPIYGKLSDIFGRRPLYLFGIGVFILGSLLSTFSTTMLMLAAFRAVQGIGGGALMSLPLAIMGDMLPPRERAKYQGYFLAVFGISSVLGPLIGGFFSGADEILWIAGWRWVFLINVPIGVFALAMVIAFLHLPQVGEKKSKPVVDWWGAAAVVLCLVPLLMVAEQGREWGWDSANSITCFVIGAVGLVAFLLIENKMGRNAIIPLKLFKSGAFSIATLLGFLVGFVMFGAMMTMPLYLQIVTGLTPTESGFATLPMVGGLMLASISTGVLVGKTGKYRIFPITGMLCVGIGLYILTFMNIDRPLWFMMIGMFFIGLGLGQNMQAITLASQGSVEPQDMGVATSSSTFFRQIGGTMGTAILLSVLFTVMPNNISDAMGNQTYLKPAMSAALNPEVAEKPENKGVMDKMWNPMVDPLKAGIQKQLDGGVAQAEQQAMSKIPAQAPDSVREGAKAKVLAAVAEKAHASVQGDKVAVDWSDKNQRDHWVDQLAPKVADKINDSDSDSNKADTSSSDTSYLNGADDALTRPFMTGFNNSAVLIYWVALGVACLALVVALFFRAPELRRGSALQEQADAHRKKEPSGK